MPESIKLDASGVPDRITLDGSMTFYDLFTRIHELTATGTPYAIGRAIGEGIADVLCERFPEMAEYAKPKRPTVPDNDDFDVSDLGPPLTPEKCGACGDVHYTIGPYCQGTRCLNRKDAQSLAEDSAKEQ